MSFQALWPGGVLNVEPPVRSRVGCSPPVLGDLVHLLQDFSAIARTALICGLGEDPVGGHAAVPVAVAHIGKRAHGCCLAGRRRASTRTSLVSVPCAPPFIRRAHSDRTRNAAVKRKTSDSSIGGRRNFHIWHSGADAQAVAGFRFDVREAAPQPDDNARNAVPDQKVRAESDDGYRQVGGVAKRK